MDEASYKFLRAFCLPPDAKQVHPEHEESIFLIFDRAFADDLLSGVIGHQWEPARRIAASHLLVSIVELREAAIQHQVGVSPFIERGEDAPYCAPTPAELKRWATTVEATTNYGVFIPERQANRIAEVINKKESFAKESRLWWLEELVKGGARGKTNIPPELVKLRKWAKEKPEGSSLTQDAYVGTEPSENHLDELPLQIIDKVGEVASAVCSKNGEQGIREEEYRRRIDYKIAIAQQCCKNPYNTNQVWNALLKMAEDDEESVIFGYVADKGIKWKDYGGNPEYLKRKQLSDKLGLERKREIK